ncbi:hypothetical protein FHETE_5815 [Fusarium heterosporum]|uniref:BTB domain-containing protein n=1 Tax=Fusarium heterosporum TaxID=42747 RepID=A0A8H5WLB0_FUSHE|nr:hypothetical protein FHETE_5815 [Fusarium heterosporum]
MASSEMHQVDSDGDALLILHHSDAPFAMSDTEQVWPNSLPEYQSTESKKQEKSFKTTKLSSVTNTALDDESTSSQSTPKKALERYKLRSHFLKRTCSYFSGLMSSEWQEANSEPGSKWTVKARDWNHEAVLIVMNILHHNIKAVPRTVILEMLAKIAVIVNYYGCNEAAEQWP